jgi:large subunit ribosomal protein L9
MEVILKETVDHLGQEGDIVKVKPGFARNFLIPGKKAVVANKGSLAILEREQDSINARRTKQQQEAEEMAKKLSSATITIAQRAGDENKLFGSVTTADIAAKLAELGMSIDRKMILLAEPIKTLGETTVSIKVGYQVFAEINVQVVPLEDE